MLFDLCSQWDEFHCIQREKGGGERERESEGTSKITQNDKAADPLNLFVFKFTDLHRIRTSVIKFRLFFRRRQFDFYSLDEILHTINIGKETAFWECSKYWLIAIGVKLAVTTTTTSACNALQLNLNTNKNCGNWWFVNRISRVICIQNKYNNIAFAPTRFSSVSHSLFHGKHIKHIVCWLIATTRRPWNKNVIKSSDIVQPRHCVHTNCAFSDCGGMVCLCARAVKHKYFYTAWPLPKWVWFVVVFHKNIHNCNRRLRTIVCTFVSINILFFQLYDIMFACNCVFPSSPNSFLSISSAYIFPTQTRERAFSLSLSVALCHPVSIYTFGFLFRLFLVL